MRTLPARQDFLRVAGGRKWITPAFILQTAPSPAGSVGINELRIGFTVTRKLGGAVIRNRIKRRLRAASREIFPAQGKHQQDYVVIARKEALLCPFPALLRDLAWALRRLHATPETSHDPAV